MELTTKCPKCSTVFDVSLDTLQQRKGYTRCVSCAYIFDGFEEIQSENSYANNPTGIDNKITNPAEPVNLMQSQPSLGPSDDKTEIPYTISSAQQKPEPENTFIIRTRPVPDNKPTEPNHKISDLENLSVATKENDFVISFDGNQEQENNHSVDFVGVDNTDRFTDDIDRFDTDNYEDEEYVDITSKILNVMWICLIAVGVAAFLLQGVYVFRVQIAQSLPDTRPRLEALCEKIGCDMPWTRKPEHILVVHSSLQSQVDDNKDKNNDVENSSEATDDLGDTTDYILQVVLRNTYDLDQEWPSLVLELTDAAGAKIARKNITAQHYLRSEYINKPFSASSEYQVQLPIKLQGLKVNGYQVTTFFP